MSKNHKFKYTGMTEKKDVVLLTVLCAASYFCSYMTRINYKAVISAIVESEGISKDKAAIALTGLFITYGIGQLVSGWLGDRINPKYLMTGGLLLASVMNLALPLNSDPVYMTVIWCINGFGQAMMWPPIVKTLTNFLDEKRYLHASVKVCWGSSLATILIYLCAPLIITFAGGWKPVFYICAAIGALGAVMVFTVLTYFERKYAMPAEESCLTENAAAGQADKKPAAETSYGSYKGLVTVFFVLLLLAILVQGSLKDGVDTWMPTYITETFDLGTSISILSGVILPIFTILSYSAATFAFEKLFKSEMVCGMSFFLLASACSGLLLLTRQINPGAGFAKIAVTAVSILLFALIVACMHAVNLIFTLFVPRKFKRFGNISWVSGLTNFATYVGSAVATYGFAVITEGFGWNLTIISWIVITLTGAAITFAANFPWKKLSDTVLKTEETK